jgi:hypothetical protein
MERNEVEKFWEGKGRWEPVSSVTVVSGYGLDDWAIEV